MLCFVLFASVISLLLYTERGWSGNILCLVLHCALFLFCLHQSCPCFFTRREGGLVVVYVWFYTVLCFVLFASVMSLLLYTERGWPGSILCLFLHCVVFLFCLHQLCPCFFTRREGDLIIFCVWFYTVLCFDCLYQSCPCFFTRREGGLVIFCVWFYTVLYFDCLHQSSPCFFTRREGGLVVFCVWFYTALCFDCLHQSCPCFFTRREGGLVIFCVWFYTVLCFVLFASVMSLLLYTERGWPGSILCLVLHCAVFCSVCISHVLASLHGERVAW